MIPISGSAYTYGYATLGEFVAWIIGWDLILEYLFAASTVAVGLVGLLRFVSSRTLGLLSRTLHLRALQSRLAAGCRLEHLAAVHRRLGQHRRGAQRAGHGHCGHHHRPAGDRHQGVGHLQQHHRRHQIAVILPFIAVGVAYINRPTGHRSSPGLGPGPLWLDAVCLRAAGVIFFAYIGFDAVSTAAQEVKKRPSATCPSAFWLRWPSAPCSTSPSRWS